MNQKTYEIKSATDRIYQEIYWSESNNRDKKEEAVRKLELRTQDGIWNIHKSNVFFF